MRVKHSGADGEVKFVAHRNVYVGFMGGKVVVTKKSEAACKTFLASFSNKPEVKKTDATRTTLTLQVAEVWQKVGALFPDFQHIATPRVEFYNRGCTAGKAYWIQHKVAFNEVLAEENPGKFMNTVIHEIAHLVTHKLFPQASAHGREFKMIMRKMGGDGERCHTYDTSSVRVVKTKKRYVYSCGCKEHRVTINVHKKVTLGHRYSCKMCRDSIKFTGIVESYQ